MYSHIMYSHKNLLRYLALEYIVAPILRIHVNKMARFSAAKFGAELKTLEKEMKEFEVFDIPLNPTNVIGEGSSAIVFLHQLRNKPSAVKKFKQWQLMSKKNLLKAAKSLRTLQHENVVRFRGYSTRPSSILFEYCEVVLDEHIKVNTVKELINVFNDHDYFVLDERTNYMLQASNGLSYLHNKNILHRDFKPANLLVAGNKENIIVKVTDFNEISTFKDTCLSTATKTDGLRGMYCIYLAIFFCQFMSSHGGRVDL